MQIFNAEVLTERALSDIHLYVKGERILHNIILISRIFNQNTSKGCFRVMQVIVYLLFTFKLEKSEIFAKFLQNKIKECIRLHSHNL